MSQVRNIQMAPQREHDLRERRRELETVALKNRIISVIAVALTLIFLFGSIAAVVITKNMVLNEQRELNERQEAINEANLTTSQLESELDEQSNLSRIIRDARALGMRSPTDDQIIRPDGSRNTHTMDTGR